MCCLGFIKRVVPFFLAFAAGLFIASFFVSVTAPTFQFKSRGWKSNHRQYDRQREAEIQQLREENRRLKNQISDAQSVDFQELRYAVPPPPPAPLAPSKLRMETVPYQGR